MTMGIFKKKTNKQKASDKLDAAIKIRDDAIALQKQSETELKVITDAEMIKKKSYTEIPPLPPEKYRQPSSKKTKGKKSEEPEKPLPVEGQNFLLEPMKKHSKFKFWHRWKLKQHPEQTFLIEMFFSNGTTKTFVIRARSESFTYKAREYYLRYEDCYFDLTHNQNKLLFHEDFTVPLKKEITKEKDPLDHKKFHPLFEVHPSALKELLDMEYIKQLTQDDLSKYLKMSLLLSAITLLLMLFIGYLWARSQGMF